MITKQIKDFEFFSQKYERSGWYKVQTKWKK